MSKKRSPRPAATETRTRQNPQLYYSEEFTESQAEKIWNRDMNLLLIGVIVILVLAIMGVI